MTTNDTPYVYGDETPDAGLTDEGAADDQPVIVEGAVMSFRSYRRRRD